LAQRAPKAIAHRTYRVYDWRMWSVDVDLIRGWRDSLDRGSWRQVIAAIEGE